jgi:hypothetical protein
MTSSVNKRFSVGGSFDSFGRKLVKSRDFMKKLLAALFLLASSAPLSARVNVLEPWSPGVDLDVPREAWGHGANMRVGRGDADLFELAYVLSHAPRSDWEVGGTLGYVSLDRPAPVKSDTGLSDLTAAAKHRFSPSSSPGALEMAAEAGLSLPTGDPDHGIGAGGVGLLLGWGAKTPVQEATRISACAFTPAAATRSSATSSPSRSAPNIPGGPAWRSRRTCAGSTEARTR